MTRDEAIKQLAEVMEFEEERGHIIRASQLREVKEFIEQQQEEIDELKKCVNRLNRALRG